VGVSTPQQDRGADVTANKALVRRFYEEVWARGNVAFTQEVFTDHYVCDDLRPAKAPLGATGQALIAEPFRRAFPDPEWRVDLVLSDGDLSARPVDCIWYLADLRAARRPARE
jgi:predicted SnoaL-like aldol condensation-catalyzing enzyme